METELAKWRPKDWVLPKFTCFAGATVCCLALKREFGAGAQSILSSPELLPEILRRHPELVELDENQGVTMEQFDAIQGAPCSVNFMRALREAGFRRVKLLVA